MRKAGILVALALVLVANLCAEVRLKDIVSVENAQQESLIGYGLVIGLNGSGDRSTSN